MALTFVPSTQLVDKNASLKLSNAFMLVGTLTSAGSYATGGDTFSAGQNLEDLLKRIGAGRVLFVEVGRGFGAEWDSTAKKLKLFSSGGTELTAAAYPAALTGSPILVYGR